MRSFPWALIVAFLRSPSWLRHRRARCILLRLARHRADRAPRRLPRRCLDVLREDNRAIIRAPSQASKAANYILGFLPGGPAQAARCSGQLRSAVEPI